MKLGKEVNGVLDIVEVTKKQQIDTYIRNGYELIAETEKSLDTIFRSKQEAAKSLV